MPVPKIFLLGAPRIEVDGMPAELDTRKALALIAYLTVTRQRHSRDSLSTLFWPEYGDSRARASLRRTLSALNRALAGDWLDIERESIGLNPQHPLWVDVDQFQQRLAACAQHDQATPEGNAACLRLLTEAIDLYRDDFMAGFALRDSPNFDEWQFFQAEGLRRELAGALEHLVRGHTSAGEWTPAIRYARRRLSLDPLHEPAHRSLMELYAWSGERAAALRQYRECVRILDHELGVPPLEETTRLYQSIKENQVLPPRVEPNPPLQPAQPPTPASPALQHASVVPHDDAPLVGRAAEWDALLRGYSTITGDGKLITIEGEPGIGKTRLAEEFLAYVQRNDATTITARCYEGENNLTFGPFVEGLRALLSQPEQSAKLAQLPPHVLSELLRLLPERALLHPGLPDPPPLDNPGAQNRFFEGITQVVLHCCAGSRPGILFLDDVQWADAASLELLAFILRRLRGRPLLVLLTSRSDQVPADHRLRQLLTEAQRAGIATTLPLPRLDQDAVVALVESLGDTATGGPGVADLSQRLYAESEGLPLFLHEYIAVLRSGTSLAEDGWSLPGGVRDLLLSRLSGVSETGWQLLHTAAAIGRSFDFDTLREASGRSEDEVLSGLEALTAQGLVVEQRETSGEAGLIFDFSHDKLRALVYEQTSLARRRLLHRRIAEALSGMRGRRAPGALAGQIAHHFRLAGQEPEAAEYARLAGDYARTLYANAEALAHYRSALALGHPAAAALHAATGDLLTLLGEYSAAVTAYETAASLADTAAVGPIEHKLGAVHHRRGEWDLAADYFKAALRALGDDGPAAERARIYADWSLTLHRSGTASEETMPSHLAGQALLLAEQAADQRALAHAHNVLGILASHQGQLGQAEQHLQRSLHLATTLGDTGAQAAALNNLALMRQAAGDLPAALQFAETALSLCITQGDRHHEAALHNNLADLHHLAGQSAAAMSHLKQAVAIYVEIGVEAGTVQPRIWGLAEW